jgi:hypothetical protein
MLMPTYPIKQTVTFYVYNEAVRSQSEVSKLFEEIAKGEGADLKNIST